MGATSALPRCACTGEKDFYSKFILLWALYETCKRFFLYVPFLRSVIFRGPIHSVRGAGATSLSSHISAQPFPRNHCCTFEQCNNVITPFAVCSCELLILFLFLQDGRRRREGGAPPDAADAAEGAGRPTGLAERGGHNETGLCAMDTAVYLALASPRCAGGVRASAESLITTKGGMLIFGFPYSLNVGVTFVHTSYCIYALPCWWCSQLRRTAVFSQEGGGVSLSITVGCIR